MYMWLSVTRGTSRRDAACPDDRLYVNGACMPLGIHTLYNTQSTNTTYKRHIETSTRNHILKHAIATHSIHDQLKSPHTKR